METIAAWSHHQPTRVIFGINSITRISEIAAHYKPTRITIILGLNSARKSNSIKTLSEILKNYEISIFDKISPNPSTDVIDYGIDFIRAKNPDLVIGMGGGSVIDAAKAITKLSANEGSCTQFLDKEKEITTNGPTLIAIPTTAGTGSEVTPYASITHLTKKRKISLTHDYLYPEVAIIDPTLTLTVSAFNTAVGGIDALSHCVEAYWSNRHTPISDLFALEGLKLIFDNLENAVKNPENLHYRERISLGSLFSGLAISTAQTTIVHSVSYPMTSCYGVTHGLACALVLPAFIDYNFEAAKSRIGAMARKIGLKDPLEFSPAIEKFTKSLLLPRKLEDVNIHEADIERIVEEGFRPDRANNNPRKVTSNDLRLILKSIL